MIEKSGLSSLFASLFRTRQWAMVAELQRQFTCGVTVGVTVPRDSRTEPVNPLTNCF